MGLFSASAMEKISGIVNSLKNGIFMVGYASLALCVLLTFTNVIGRYILKKPLLGEVDMVQLTMAIFGGIAIFLTVTRRGLISVDVLIVKLSNRAQEVWDRISLLAGFLTWGGLAYLSFLDAIDKMETGDVTATMNIPQWPFAFCLATGLTLVSLTQLIQLFLPKDTIEKTHNPEEEGAAS
jgi:TRAP-type C4-dicarboxylate transport system permease small subunit